MDKSRQVLSDIITWMKYAKYIPELQRREIYFEIVDRNKEMHIEKFPWLKEEIEDAYKFVYDKKVLPSMRALQFSGKPIQLSPNRQYNCGYTAIDNWLAFPEIMFLLLGGTGVGYSVQSHHINKLPAIIGPNRKKTKRHLIADSIEGWADAVKILLDAYINSNPTPRFDYSDIRPKGALLRTSGGRAPGPQPLKDCIHNLKKILDAKEAGTKLTSLEAHDAICYIADAVLAGGIRRAALISLFDIDDEDMLTSKFGRWWELNPQRARANNSAVVARHKITKKRFKELWKRIRMSGSGEPGIYFSNNPYELGTNPCCEISLRNMGFCNLTTVNVSNVEGQKDFDARVKAAAFIGTLQASYTDFHYLREEWKINADKEALLGVSMTGIASGEVLKLNITKASKIAVTENKRVAKLIKIRPAARVTCTKPEGTSSTLLGCSSGIHDWHSKFYIRRVRVNKEEAIYPYLLQKIPKLVEDDVLKPKTDAVISMPIKAPENAIYRGDSIQLLNRVKTIYRRWVLPGHNRGDNTHNVSATISVKDGEWNEIGEWMWKNKNYYNGLSVVPYDGGTYPQLPFDSCTEEEYENMLKSVHAIDLSQIHEDTDNTDLKGEIACAGGKCDIA